MTDREQFLSDIIVTAIEGGIGYWSTTFYYRAEGRVIVGDFGKGPADCYSRTCAIVVVSEDGEDGQEYIITSSVIEQGIARLLNGSVSYSWDVKDNLAVADIENDAGMLDADDADAIVQAALLGAIVYG
jgi:hypothetical protein